MASDGENQADGGARAPDDYEARYMAGDSVVYRDKMRAPGAFFAILGIPVFIQAVVAASLAMAPAPIPLGVFAIFPLTAAFVAIMALLFAVLRVTVSRHEVHIQYGLFGPKIPVHNITSAEAVTYDWKKYGGWGIRRARDGSWAYNMMGDAGRAVKIVWTDEKGSTNTTLVASSNPDALARAIAAARGGKRIDAGAGKSRIAPIDAEFAAEAEAEAEAALREDDQKTGSK